MTMFEALRGDFGFSYYGEKRTAVTIDIPLAAVTYTCILVSIAALIAAAGIRGKQKWYTVLRLIYSLFIGTIIILSIFGYCWQVGFIHLDAPYIYRSDSRVQGEIGMKVSLRNVNVTLIGTFEGGKGVVNYNEEIALDDVGVRKNELRHCIQRGLPHPMISVVEYLSVDEGGLRWGRNYRTAGFLTYILLWTAFSFWLVANIMVCSVVFYGAIMFALTGFTMVAATVTYHVLQPTHPFRMNCLEGSFRLEYGWCFWSICVFGTVTTILSLVLVALDHKIPKRIAKFFLLEQQIEEENDDCFIQFPALNPEPKLRKASSATNFYVNYGFHFEDMKRTNPLYEEAEESLESQSLPRKKEEHFLHRPISSEYPIDNDVFKKAEDGSDTYSQCYSTESEVERLKEIYVDVEASHHDESTGAPHT